MEGADNEINEFDATFLDQPAILDKIKACGLITDEALKLAVSKAVVDADIHTVCQEVDKFMDEELKKVFSNKKSKKLERGIAMPCCISVNEIAGHYSPMSDESDKLKEGDVAKIDLGCHIDGYAAQAAKTIVVSADAGSKVDGRKADVILAAHEAMRAAVRAIKPSASNYDVTDAIAAISADFECSPLEGVLSHSMKKHLIDGNEVIINKESPENKVKEFQFEPGQVFSLDIYVSTGEGTTKQADKRITVYKRELDVQYSLRIQKARQFFAEVNNKYPTLPFSIAGFADTTGAKVGVKECVEHNLLQEYVVLQEKKGELIAQFKATVVVQPNATAVICGHLDQPDARFSSDKSVKNEDAKKLIESEIFKKVKEGKKK